MSLQMFTKNSLLGPVHIPEKRILWFPVLHHTYQQKKTQCSNGNTFFIFKSDFKLTIPKSLAVEMS